MTKKNYIYIILMIIISIPVFVISFYVFPDFDDFAYSIDTYHTVLNGGNIIDIIIAAFNTSMEYMQKWQGLYTSAFLLALQPSIFGENFYFLTTFVIVTSLFAGIYLFVRAINKNFFKTKENNILLTALILFFIIQTIPNPFEAFYWFNGAVNYVFFIGLLLIIVSEYINLYNREKINIFRLILLCILSFLLSGGNHITAFAGLFIGFILVLMLFINKKNKLLIIPFITGVLGFIYNITSPGTGIRAGAVDFNGDVIETLIMTFRKSFGFFSNFTTFSLILLVLLILFIQYKNIKNWSIKFNKKFILIPVLSYILLCGLYCIPYYALGGYGGSRVTDTIYIIFVILLLVNLGLLFKYLLDKKIINFSKVKINQKLKFILPIIVIIFIGYFGSSVYYNSTTYEAVRELTSGEARTFKNEQQARFDKYTAEEIEKVIVKPLTAKPYLVFGIEACIINEDNDCSSNAINDYYDKKVIGMKE